MSTPDGDGGADAARRVLRFERFAADFEAALADDDWSRLTVHLVADATYENVGDPASRCIGRDAILAFLKVDVDRHDRRFDGRELVALTPPEITGDRLSRRWRCTYRLAGAPDLVVEGEARYRFDGDLIRSMEQQVTPESLARVEAWMRDHGERLSTT